MLHLGAHRGTAGEGWEGARAQREAKQGYPGAARLLDCKETGLRAWHQDMTLGTFNTRQDAR